MSINRLARDHKNAMLGGVCAGLAARYDLDLTLVRVGVVLLAVFSFGAVAVAYFAAWVLMPLPDATDRRASDIARANVEDVVGTARRAASAVAHTNRDEIVETTRRAAREATYAARYAAEAARSTLQRDPARRRDHRPSDAAPPTPPPTSSSTSASAEANAAAAATSTPAATAAAPPYPTPASAAPPPSAEPAALVGVGSEAEVAPEAPVEEDGRAVSGEMVEEPTGETAAAPEASTSEPSADESPAPESTSAAATEDTTSSTESQPWVPPPPPPRAEQQPRPRPSGGGGFEPPGSRPTPPSSGPSTPPGTGGPRLP